MAGRESKRESEREQKERGKEGGRGGVKIEERGRYSLGGTERVESESVRDGAGDAEYIDGEVSSKRPAPACIEHASQASVT